MSRWDDPQPPFDWEEFKRTMRGLLKRQPRPSIAPVRAPLVRAWHRKRVAAALYVALGMRPP